MQIAIDTTKARARIAESSLLREREYAAFAEWQQKSQTELWRRLGGSSLEFAARPEVANVAGDIVLADEVIDSEKIEAQARQLVETYTPTAKRLRQGEAVDNARSALFEALVASGHMSVIEIPGGIDEVHADVMTRLLNSYHREGIAEHERNRNFAEICEELRIKAVMDQIVQGDMPPSTKVVTVSDFAESLGSDADKHGYRTANHKGMIRETSLTWRGGEWVRVIKQISRSNAFAGETEDKFTRAGLKVQRPGVAKDVGILGSQLLSVRYGALEVVRLLDRLNRNPILFGEPVVGTSKSYDNLEERSKERESFMKPHIERLAAYEKALDKQLAEGKITVHEQQKLYIEQIRDHVRAICVRFPEYTKDALGEAVVADYENAHKYYASGDSAGAASAVSGASARESAVVVCGGATDASQQTQSAQENSLRSILEKTMLREKKWVGCPFCGEKEAYYGDPCDVNMDCRTCGAYTRDGRVVSSGNGGRRSESSSAFVKKQEVPQGQTPSERDGVGSRIVKEIYGKYAAMYFRRTIGTVALDIIDRRSKRVIATNVQLGA